jgi:hypothetical protein
MIVYPHKTGFTTAAVVMPLFTHSLTGLGHSVGM